jgi:hypothetical protein
LVVIFFLLAIHSGKDDALTLDCRTHGAIAKAWESRAHCATTSNAIQMIRGVFLSRREGGNLLGNAAIVAIVDCSVE